jgi:hypothetical protein
MHLARLAPSHVLQNPLSQTKGESKVKNKTFIGSIVALSIVAAAYAGVPCPDPFSPKVNPNGKCLFKDETKPCGRGSCYTWWYEGVDPIVKNGGCSTTSFGSSNTCDKTIVPVVVTQPILTGQWASDPSKYSSCTTTTETLYYTTGFSTSTPCDFNRCGGTAGTSN